MDITGAEKNTETSLLGRTRSLVQKRTTSGIPRAPAALSPQTPTAAHGCDGPTPTVHQARGAL